MNREDCRSGSVLTITKARGCAEVPTRGWSPSGRKTKRLTLYDKWGASVD